MLVTRCKITCYSLQNPLVTRCRSCSLQKITRYSLQNSLVTRCRSWSLQKITRYSLQKLLVPKHHSLQNSLVTRCKNSLVTHYTADFDRYLLCKVTTDKKILGFRWSLKAKVMWETIFWRISSWYIDAFSNFVHFYIL